MAFFLLVLSWLLERSLEDLRLLALAWRLLGGLSVAAGDMERSLLSREPEWVLERVLRCSLTTRFFLAFLLLRELDRDRDRDIERDEDRSSTTRCVVSCGMSGLGGPSGSRMVTRVTVRSSELKKACSSQGSGAAEVRLPRGLSSSSSVASWALRWSALGQGPREASASKTPSTV